MKTAPHLAFGCFIACGLLCGRSLPAEERPRPAPPGSTTRRAAPDNSPAKEKSKPAPIPLEILPDHPRLLIHREELLQLKARCALSESPKSNQEIPRNLAATAKVFQALRQWVDSNLNTDARPGFLYSPALLHLVTGQPGTPDQYTRYVTRQFLGGTPFPQEGDDAVIALDWCWDAIHPSDRERIVRQLLTDARPLSTADSPLIHAQFFPKLQTLAVVLTAHGQTLGRLGRTQLGEDILQAAAAYLEGPFIDLFKERGAMGTSPANALYENADAAFAAEIWQTGTGRPMWPRLRGSLGRVCESYFYALSEWESLDHGFLHNDGSFAPWRPCTATDTPAPILPWVIGRRTADPFAGWFAKADLPAGTFDARDDPLNRHWWARLVYSGAEQRFVNPESCPTARNLGGGWVTMRSDFSAGATLVLLDAGQPLFRNQQHLDAGHFIIHRKGILTQGGGQDVAHQTIAAKNGFVRTGDEDSDWDYYSLSTGAHNCITISDPIFRQRRYDRWWLSGDSQIVTERNYRPADGSLNEAKRTTGRLTAFQNEAQFTYAVCDLAPAWPNTVVSNYTRQFLFFHAGVLVVVDRLSTTRKDQTVRWNLQLLSRPKLGGADLPANAQTQGRNPEAGIWTIDSPGQWLEVSDGGGKLMVRTILPFDMRWRIIGGPKQILTVPEGPHSGRTYVGGSKDSYEHWIYPPRTNVGTNVWYRLGKPTDLGPHFELGASWGRLEVQSINRQSDHLFCHVLATLDQADKPPDLSAEIDANMLNLNVTLGRTVCNAKLAVKGVQTNQVSARNISTGQTLWTYDLANTVAPEEGVPVRTGPATSPHAP